MIKSIFYPLLYFYSFCYIGKFIKLNNQNLFSFSIVGWLVYYSFIRENKQIK